MKYSKKTRKYTNIFKSAIIRIALISLLATQLILDHDVTAESNVENVVKENIDNVDTIDNVEESLEVQTQEENEEKKEDKVEEEKKLLKSIVDIPVVIAISDVNIRASIKGEIVGVLLAGQHLEIVEKVNDAYYKVLYYGQEAYVSSKYVTPATILDINNHFTKTFYTLEEKQIFIPSDISESGEDENKTLEKYEFLKVYGEVGNRYFVQTSNYIGYVSKDNLEELKGTFLVVDRSDQNAKIYENNEVILDCPVTIEHKNTSARVGAFEIYNITPDSYLVFENNGDTTWINMRNDDVAVAKEHVRKRTRAIIQE